MTLRRSVLRGGAAILAGQGTSHAMMLLRMMIVARALTLEDIGIAVTFALSVAFVEMISELSAGRLIVQAKDGDDAKFQRTAQLLQAVRGVACGAALVLFAGPIASLFEIPQATWAFRWLALIPVLRGFVHLDQTRVQRELRFGSASALDAGSQALTVAAAWPLAAWLGDYSAMLWLLILQAASYTVGSHLVAERPYRWSWDRGRARRMFIFGWPLLINGVLLFCILQGDRLLIGSAGRVFGHDGYAWAGMALYSQAFMLAMMPTKVGATASRSLFLPLLARVQDSAAMFRQRVALCAELLSLAGMGVAVLLIVAGAPVMVLLFGAKFAAAGALVGWLGAGQALRLMRVAPNIAAMAKADTSNPLWANVFRVTGVVGAVAGAWAGWGLVWIAIAAFGGEVVALGASIVLLSRRQGVPLLACAKPALLFLASIAGAAGVSMVLGSAHGLTMTDPEAPMPLAAFIVPLAAAACLAAVSAGIMVLFSPELRRHGLELVAAARAHRSGVPVAAGESAEA